MLPKRRVVSSEVVLDRTAGQPLVVSASGLCLYAECGFCFSGGAVPHTWPKKLISDKIVYVDLFSASLQLLN
jgi:hypothetical protein